MSKYEEDILSITGEEAYFYWSELKPKIYYLNGEPYGLIGIGTSIDGVTIVASTTLYPELPFTVGMLRDIIKVYNESSILLITDYEPAQEVIRKVLDKYNFTYEYKDNVMYSTHINTKDT